MENKIYIIVHCEDQGTSAPEINVFYSNEKAVRHVAEIVEEQYDVKPDPSKDVEEYIGEYYYWVFEENEGECDVVIRYEILELK